jgi:hypothetical protein
MEICKGAAAARQHVIDANSFAIVCERVGRFE